MFILKVDYLFRLDIVYVRGKRGRQVPVIMSKIDLEASNALNKWRSNVGVLATNVFIFAAQQKSQEGLFEVVVRYGMCYPILMD